MIMLFHGFKTWLKYVDMLKENLMIADTLDQKVWWIKIINGTKIRFVEN